MKKVLIGTIIGGFMTVMGLVVPASATGSTPFTTPPPAPFSQALYGVVPSFLGGVAFAPNGDPLVDNCFDSGSAVYRFDHTTTLPVTNGTSTLHPVTALPNSNAGCGLANHPNGALYTNTSSGVIKLDANTGAQLAGPFGPGGDALGIAVDPQTGNLAYVLDSGAIGFVDPGFTTTGTLSTVTSGGFVDQITYDPTGNYLFLSNRSLNALTILKRDGTLVQNAPLAFGVGPDGIAFHATAPTFVLTNDNDGTLTRFDFPGSDFTMTPTQSIFASGGFRGDMSQVGPDGCLYLTQAGGRYDDGTVTGDNSLVQICPGFALPPGVGSDIPVTNTCDRTITGDVPGSVVVPSGTTCLFKATVHGSMTVQSGAAASVLNSTVAGSFSASGAAGITICNSHLSSVSITGSTRFVLIGDGGDGSSSCAGNTVSGSVNVSRQQGGLELGGNTVTGSVIVQSNLAPGTPPGTPTEDAATEIEGNQLRSSLICVSNTPAPVNDGHVNTVVGSRSGQCTGTL